jgi:hypothetical protein
MGQIMNHDGLALRPMTFEDITYDDDYLVIWRGLPIGRILKQPGVAYGQPNWWWGIHFVQRQTPDLRGVERDLDACKARLREAWERLSAKLTDADVDAFCRHNDAVERRLRR